MPFLVSTNPVVTVSGTVPIISTNGPTPVISIQDSTIEQKGAVQLEDSLTSTSITKAATPKSVKEIHDDLTTISGSLQTDIDGKSDIGHIHDDRYYTETEVDDLIITVSGGSNDHSKLNNLDFASAGHTGFVSTDDLTTVSGGLQTQITTNKDHGNLDGLSDDDHTQYLLIDGTRAMTSHLDMDSNSVNNINVANLKAISCIVHNATGSTLTAGTCVYPSGVVGGVVCVDKCDITDRDKMPCLGVISVNISNGATGKAVTRGIKSMDTSGFDGSVGDRIFVQADGSINTTVPISGSIQRVGILTVKAADGQIYIQSRGRKSIFAAANEHPELRMGSDAGHQRICFLDYSNNEKGCIDADGNLTLSGTVDTVDIAAFKSDYDGHTHDDYYYTESEVDTISGTLQTEIDDISESSMLKSVYDTNNNGIVDEAERIDGGNF